jgi:F-type H+-transporting ATPase subunit alpha
LKQGQYSPIPLEEQVVILYLANTNRFAEFDKEDIKPFFRMFADYITSIRPQILSTIRDTGEFSDEIGKLVNTSFDEYYLMWKSQHEDYGTDT